MICLTAWINSIQQVNIFIIIFKFDIKRIRHKHGLLLLSIFNGSFLPYKFSIHSFAVPTKQTQISIVFPVYLSHTNILHWQYFTFALFPLHFTTWQSCLLFSIVATSSSHLLTERVKAWMLRIFLVSSATRRITNFVLRIFLPVANLYAT
jgi:hypothetical protein